MTLFKGIRALVLTQLLGTVAIQLQEHVAEPPTAAMANKHHVSSHPPTAGMADKPPVASRGATHSHPPTAAARRHEEDSVSSHPPTAAIANKPTVARRGATHSRPRTAAARRHEEHNVSGRPPTAARASRPPAARRGAAGGRPRRAAPRRRQDVEHRVSDRSPRQTEHPMGNYTSGSPDGARVTHPPLIAKMSIYPGYAGSISMSGKVMVDVMRDDSLMVTFALFGMEDDVDGDLNIHSGTTCDTEADVGGHYYMVSPDPWVTKYSSGSSGVAIGSFTLNSGIGYKGNAGRTVVAHASDGTRVGCGVLEERPSTAPPLVALIAVYPGLSGSRAPTGTISVEFLPDGYLEMLYQLHGLEANTTGSLHIDSDTTCHYPKEKVGGHHWLVAHDRDDPWSINYTSNSAGHASGVFSLDNGYGHAGNVGHAVVLRAADGTPIACGVLQEKS